MPQLQQTARVAVLMGGPSSEHEVSLNSGRAVAGALREAGFTVDGIVLETGELPPLHEDVRAVFPALHGRFGEDGTVQRLLEERGLPYVGCDPAVSELLLDKARTREVLEQNGLPVAAGMVVTRPDVPLPESLGLPLIVKPNREGSTIGMAKVNGPDDWRPALEEALRHDTDIVVEKFVIGCEVTIGILFDEPMPVIEIVPPGEIYDYDAKYVYAHGKTEYLCPPRSLSKETQKRLQDLALATFHTLGARDLLRVDIIVNADETIILEGNSIPGFTATSLIPKAAKAAGLAFPNLCARLIDAALARGGG
jgi:D-alanine-D-alanine ligase